MMIVVNKRQCDDQVFLSFFPLTIGDFFLLHLKLFDMIKSYSLYLFSNQLEYLTLVSLAFN